jgi:hypothetical protein
MMLVERVAALHEVDLFSAVPGRMLASVAATADEVTVEPGSTFIEHGAVEDCLYVVVSGRVRVHHGGQVSLSSAPARQLRARGAGARPAVGVSHGSRFDAALRLRKAVLTNCLPTGDSPPG